MKWSPEQDAALVAAADWLKDPDKQVFRIFGFAGTGKTTLARHLAEGVDGRTLFGAYTGKAAHVLRKMGCGNATTIHSMIYRSRDKSRATLKELEASLAECLHEISLECKNDGDEFVKQRIDKDPAVIELRRKIKAEQESQAQPFFSLNHDSDVKDAKLVVIDEVSMVDGIMGPDLLSFGTKVLVLGDPAQLPPVAGSGFFTEGITPDVMLTGIHRQAADNPIIAMATQVREEKALAVGSYGESLVAEKVHIDETHALAADQILVGKNKTRNASNRRMRALHGITDILPVPDDRLVCLRNNHDKGLLNGAIWYVDDVGELGEDRMYLTVRPEEGGDSLGVEAHTQYFQGRGDDLGWWERKEAEEFDYGYTLTVHKSQGSQWDNVLLFDESYCFRKDRWRWLYTGLTRAAEKVTIVKM